MREFRVLDRLREVARCQWGRCFPEEVENYDYLLAVEESGLKGFSFRYLTAWQADTLDSAVSLFITDYSLDTTLQGIGRRFTSSIKTLFLRS